MMLAIKVVGILRQKELRILCELLVNSLCHFRKFVNAAHFFKPIFLL